MSLLDRWIGSLDNFRKNFGHYFFIFFVPLRHFSFSSETPISCKLCYLKFFFSVLMPCSFYFQCFFPPLCFNFQFLLIYLEVYYFFFQNVYSLLIPEECLFHIRDFTFYLWKFDLGLFIPSGFLCNTFSLFSSILDICNTVIIIVLLSLSTNSRTCHRFDGL